MLLNNQRRRTVLLSVLCILFLQGCTSKNTLYFDTHLQPTLQAKQEFPKNSGSQYVYCFDCLNSVKNDDTHAGESHV